MRAIGAAALIIALCLPAQGRESRAVLIPTEQSSIKLVAITMDGSRVQSASFRGSLWVSGIVRFGWVDGQVDGSPEMQIELSSSSLKKLPRSRDNTAGYDSFVIENPDGIAIALYGRSAVVDLMAGRRILLEVDAKVLLHKLTYSTDCGTHYAATATNAKPLNVGATYAEGPGVPAHC